MAKKGANRVELTTGTQTQIFEVNHAERLLRMPNNGGWKLPEDSPYKFDKGNGITVRTNKGQVSEAES